MAPGRFVDAVGTRTPAAQPWMPVLGYLPPGSVWTNAPYLASLRFHQAGLGSRLSEKVLTSQSVPLHLDHPWGRETPALAGQGPHLSLVPHGAEVVACGSVGPRLDVDRARLGNVVFRDQRPVTRSLCHSSTHCLRLSVLDFGAAVSVRAPGGVSLFCAPFASCRCLGSCGGGDGCS